MRRQWKHFNTFLSADFFLPDNLFAYDNDALMQNLTFTQMIQKDNEQYERELRQWGFKKQSDYKISWFHISQDLLEITRGKCYGDKENRGELKEVMGKCDHTQTGTACCWWLPAQTGWRAVVQAGPALHLQSKCLVHCTGISCAASPSSGLGHLKIHGCLKQKTATQLGCYTTDSEASGTPDTRQPKWLKSDHGNHRCAHPSF